MPWLSQSTPWKSLFLYIDFSKIEIGGRDIALGAGAYPLYVKAPGLIPNTAQYPQHCWQWPLSTRCERPQKIKNIRQHLTLQLCFKVYYFPWNNSFIKLFQALLFPFKNWTTHLYITMLKTFHYVHGFTLVCCALVPHTTLLGGKKSSSKNRNNQHGGSQHLLIKLPHSMTSRATGANLLSAKWTWLETNINYTINPMSRKGQWLSRGVCELSTKCSRKGPEWKHSG